jgi:hypothetical protein
VLLFGNDKKLLTKVEISDKHLKLKIIPKSTKIFISEDGKQLMTVRFQLADMGLGIATFENS